MSNFPSAIYDRADLGDASSKAAGILSLARIGVAASDTSLVVDLKRCGYEGLLEVIGGLAAELSELRQKTTTQ